MKREWLIIIIIINYWKNPIFYFSYYSITIINLYYGWDPGEPTNCTWAFWIEWLRCFVTLGMLVLCALLLDLNDIWVCNWSYLLYLYIYLYIKDKFSSFMSSPIYHMNKSLDILFENLILKMLSLCDKILW